jgi:hypothetical protein
MPARRGIFALADTFPIPISFGRGERRRIRQQGYGIPISERKKPDLERGLPPQWLMTGISSRRRVSSKKGIEQERLKVGTRSRNLRSENFTRGSPKSSSWKGKTPVQGLKSFRFRLVAKSGH